MESPTYIALSRLMSQTRAMDVIAGNIANTNTPGYKAEHVQFSDWLLPTHDGLAATGERTIAFAQDRATWRDQSSGSLTQTGDPLDLAIGGEGFFSVQTPNGVRLTRAGRFTLQADGTVSDADGHALLDDHGAPVNLGSGSAHISIAGDGTITTEQGRAAKIGVVEPTDLNRLAAEGSHLFRADTQTVAVTKPGLIQGATESSNVSPMLEMTRMMQLGRDFQFVTQFVQAEGDRQQGAIDKLSAEPSAET